MKPDKIEDGSFALDKYVTPPHENYSEKLSVGGIRSVIPAFGNECPDCENLPVLRKNCKVCDGTGRINP